MPTSQLTNKQTRLRTEDQADLAAFGLLRKTAMKNAAPSENSQAFFGIKDSGEDTELKFDASIEDLQHDNMTVAMVAPEDKTFNMLLTTDFNEAVKAATEQDLRAFLRDTIRKV